MGPLVTLLVQHRCNTIFRVVLELKEHAGGWRSWLELDHVLASAPEGISNPERQNL